MAISYWKVKKWRRRLKPAFFPNLVKIDTPLVPVCKSLLTVINSNSKNIKHRFPLSLLARLTNGVVKLYQRKVCDIFDKCCSHLDEINYETDYAMSGDESKIDTFSMEADTENVQRNYNDSDIEIMRSSQKKSSSTRRFNEINLTRQKTISPIFQDEKNNGIPHMVEGYSDKNSISSHNSNQHAFMFDDAFQYAENKKDSVEIREVNYSFEGLQINMKRHVDNQHLVDNEKDNNCNMEINMPRSYNSKKGFVTSHKRKAKSKQPEFKTIPINVKGNAKAHLRCKSWHDDIIKLEKLEKNNDLFTVPSFLTSLKKSKSCVNSKLIDLLSKRYSNTSMKSNAKEKLKNNRIQNNESCEKNFYEKSKKKSYRGVYKNIQVNVTKMPTEENFKINNHESDPFCFPNIFCTSTPLLLNENLDTGIEIGNKSTNGTNEHCEKSVRLLYSKFSDLKIENIILLNIEESLEENYGNEEEIYIKQHNLIHDWSPQAILRRLHYLWITKIFSITINDILKMGCTKTNLKITAIKVFSGLLTLKKFRFVLIVCEEGNNKIRDILQGPIFSYNHLS